MTRDTTFELTQAARKDNFTNAKTCVNNKIIQEASKGNFSICLSLNIWFENVDYCDIKEFTKELKTKGFEINLDSEVLEISWK